MKASRQRTSLLTRRWEGETPPDLKGSQDEKARQNRSGRGSSSIFARATFPIRETAMPARFSVEAKMFLSTPEQVFRSCVDRGRSTDRGHAKKMKVRRTKRLQFAFRSPKRTIDKFHKKIFDIFVLRKMDKSDSCFKWKTLKINSHSEMCR